MSNYDPAVIAAIRTIGQQRYGSDPKKLRRYLEGQFDTGIVESGLRDLSGGDADSYGYRQQRSSVYGKQDLNTQVNNLYNEFEQYDKGQPIGQLIADVQRPAAQYRGRYSQQSVIDQARHLLGGDSGAAGGLQVLGSGGSTAPTATGMGNGGLFNYLAQTAPTTNPLQAQLQRGWSLMAQLQGQQSTPQVAPTSSPSNVFATNPFNAGGQAGEVTVSKTADRAGVHTNPAVVDFVGKIAGRANEPLQIGTGTNHSQMTVDGNVSDHWTGKAADIPATGKNLIKLGQDALIEAGMDPAKARQQSGGLYNINGYQIIFNTHEGGDHTNHLHVGLGRILNK